MTRWPEPTPDEVRAAHARIAAMVEVLGAPVLPIFLRLEAEVAALDRAEDAMARARAVAAHLKRQPTPTP